MATEYKLSFTAEEVNERLIKVDELETSIDELVANQYDVLENAGLIGIDGREITDLTQYKKYLGFINNANQWTNLNEKYQFVLVPITAIGTTLSITAHPEYALYFVGLRSFAPFVASDIPDFSTSSGWTGRQTVPKNFTKNYIVPDDVKYLVFFIVYNTHECYPSNILINIPYSKGRLDILEDKVGIIENGAYQVKWLALGDSITEGYYSIAGENSEDTESHKSIDECYCAWIAKMKKFNLDNRGVGGSGWIKRGTEAAPKLNAREQIDATNEDGSYVLDFTQYDVCTIMWGVNDWKGSQNLGAFEDGSNPEVESVYGNMRYVIETILNRNPKIKLFIITPVNCRQDTSARPSSADINWGIGFAFGGQTLEEYYTAIKTVCEYYGVEMIDMLHNSIINRINAETLLPDKVHPSLDAHKQMGIELAGRILYGG